jgi:pimeloyl-ACP methyl ester carboxylesterase
MPDSGRSIFVTAPDGLRLHVREYGAHNASAAAVCLPGLTRTVADFEVLAPALAESGSRRVICLDARGRGLSEYDRNPENYNLLVELGDVVAVLTALAVGPAVFIGSSRGGLETMYLGMAHPSAITGVVLHDIGPVIEPRGLAGLKGYVGKLPQPRTFAEGGDILRQLFQSQFPKLTVEQWLAWAQRTWRLREPASAKAEGVLVPTYDIRLARTLDAVDIEQPPPPLWNEFDALARVPILVIRGARSELLSAETVAAMAARHPGLESIEVADQGHVPLLEGELVARIVEFVVECGKRPLSPQAGQGSSRKKHGSC